MGNGNGNLGAGRNVASKDIAESPTALAGTPNIMSTVNGQQSTDLGYDFLKSPRLRVAKDLRSLSR